MEATFARLLDTVMPLSGREKALPSIPPAPPRIHFFEDVLLAPGESSGADGDDRGIFQIAASTVEEIQSVAGLALRFAALFNHRHDVLHTLAAWWREHEPRRREIPFTEVARGFAPLWKELLHFQNVADELATNTFDPLRTPALATLRETRESLVARYWEALSATPARDGLAPHRLAELLAPVPRRYAPLLGTSVFVQPVDKTGSTWMLNRLGEGTGRYLSRITPVLAKFPGAIWSRLTRRKPRGSWTCGARTSTCRASGESASASWWCRRISTPRPFACSTREGDACSPSI